MDDLAALASVVGLDLVVKLYPGGSPVRDAAHVRIMSRLKALLPAAMRLAAEVPIPIPGDQRAVDAMVVDPPLRLGFELESRLLDAQGLARRVALKQRDARLARMVLVVPDTPANRAAAASGQATLDAGYPVGHRATLAALRAGELPKGNGILWV